MAKKECRYYVDTFNNEIVDQHSIDIDLPERYYEISPSDDDAYVETYELSSCEKKRIEFAYTNQEKDLIGSMGQRRIAFFANYGININNAHLVRYLVRKYKFIELIKKYYVYA